MTLTDAFEKVFILTLPGAEERRAVLEGHLREVGIVELARVTWVRAVAGSVCPPPIWFRAGEGAWGCFCSHVRMAQDAAMDGVESYFVIEDDATFRADACERLGRVMAELPEDWGQLYLGGEHLREPVALSGRAAVMRAGNVNRTHAYAVHRRALARFQYHVTNAVDFATARGGWHIDHQMGRAHERELWPAYCARRWLAGQRGGKSSITGRVNATLWWHPRSWAGRLPFVEVPGSAGFAPAGVHCGNNLKPGTCEDIGLDACVESDEKLAKWLSMIAREASDRELLPGWSHVGISRERVAGVWKAGVASALTGGWKKFREGTGIVLNWSPVPGATGYVIYRSSTPNRSFSWPTEFLPALLETTYFDKGNTDKNAKVKGLNSGSDYYYQVTAVNAAGISPATTVQVAAQ